MEDKNNKGVAIVVPTKDRPDFVIRQMNYYAGLNSEHPIYYSDASNEENLQKVKKEIDKLQNRLNVNHLPSPDIDTIKRIVQLLSLVKEKYVVFIGDDDYQPPDTLHLCAEFLENNPDYKTTLGRSVTIRVEGNQAYGNLTGVHDYPRYSIEAETASQRLTDYLGPYFTSITAAVVPTQDLLRYLEEDIKDISIKGELLLGCLMVAEGKHKILDCLGLVRQIHKSHYRLDDMFDQFTNPDWNDSYQKMRLRIVNALSATDKITIQEAELNFKKAFWFNFQKYISKGYFDTFSKSQPQKKNVLKQARTAVASRLPFLRKI